MKGKNLGGRPPLKVEESKVLGQIVLEIIRGNDTLPSIYKKYKKSPSTVFMQVEDLIKDKWVIKGKDGLSLNESKFVSYFSGELKLDKKIVKAQWRGWLEMFSKAFPDRPTSIEEMGKFITITVTMAAMVGKDVDFADLMLTGFDKAKELKK